jgi:hypothetical protein
MSQGREKDVLGYVATLRAEQEKLLLKGAFTRIEEYRAACAVVRNLERIERVCIDIMNGRDADDALREEGMTEMPDDKGTT